MAPKVGQRGSSQLLLAFRVGLEQSGLRQQSGTDYHYEMLLGLRAECLQMDMSSSHNAEELACFEWRKAQRAMHPQLLVPARQKPD